MANELLRVRLQLPFSSAEQFARNGPCWTDMWVREGTSDEDVLREVWIEDTYRVRGIDLRPITRDSVADAYERAEPLGRTVIDVGACTGIFTVMCLAYGASHVIAVEPEPENVRLLRKNLSAYNGRVTIIDAAISGDGKPVQFFGEAGTGHTTVSTPEITLRNAGGMVVQTITEHTPIASHTLAEIIDLARTPIALLKMDVEGAEYDTLLACPHETLARVELFAIETHGPELHPWVTARLGDLAEHLAYTHAVSMFGAPDRGGMLFCHRYDL